MPSTAGRRGIRSFIRGISDLELIEKIIRDEGVTTVAHLVSTLLPGADMNGYLEDMGQVQESTVRILDLCARTRLRFAYFSSGGTIYGAQHGVLNESDRAEPISFYGLSKLQMEELVLFYHRRYGLDYLILRPSNPYGSGQNLRGKQGLIAVILGKVLSGEPVAVFGDGSVIRDYHCCPIELG